MATQVIKSNISPEPSIEICVAEFTLVSADTFTFTHGLPDKPRFITVFLKNLVAELGYAVGDDVVITDSAGFTVAVNKTDVKLSLVTVPSIVNPTTHLAVAVTPANWNLVIKAEF